MRRDLQRLTGGPFDVLIIGAGIYGVTIACDAARRGLSVAIVDRGDVGGETSFNNLKTVHGGLRSLQHANLREMRLFVTERRALARIAPHLVHPLAFLVPTDRSLQRNRAVFRLALALNDLVAYDRNRLPDPSKHLPPGRLLSRDACVAIYPGFDAAEITGGALWHDCQMYSPDRVTLAFFQSAVEAGAAAATYAEVTGFLGDGPRVTGAHLQDRETGAPFDVRARLVINAAGPWAGRLLALPPLSLRPLPVPALSRALNLVVDRRLTDGAAIGGRDAGRYLFAVPWRQYSVIGTSHEPWNEGPDALRVTAADVERLVAAANRAFPGAGLAPSEVRLVHRGLLPAAASGGRTVQLIKQSWIRDHARDGAPGLMSVQGVRYTTARATAERAVDLALAILGRSASPCRTAVTPLAGGDIPRFADFEREMSSYTPARLGSGALFRLARLYGTRCPQVTRLIEQDEGLSRPLGASCAVTHAEILHAVRGEMALRLADAVLRRTEAGSGGHPGHDALAAAAGVMAAELGWTPHRTREEIEAVERVYRLDDDEGL